MLIGIGDIYKKDQSAILNNSWENHIFSIALRNDWLADLKTDGQSELWSNVATLQRSYSWYRGVISSYIKGEIGIYMLLIKIYVWHVFSEDSQYQSSSKT